MAGNARYRLIKVPTKSEDISVYASPRVGHALEEIRAKNDLYEGVRLLQVLEAVYTQGKKDGARDAINDLDKRIAETKKAIAHRNPGRPRRRRS
jgi:hypothetical protein